MAADPFYDEDWRDYIHHAPRPARRRRFRRPDLRPLGLLRHRAAPARPRVRAQVPDPLRREGGQDRPRQPGPRPALPVLGPPAPARLPRGPPPPPSRRGRGAHRRCSNSGSRSSRTASRASRARSTTRSTSSQFTVKPEDTAGPPAGWGIRSADMRMKRSTHHRGHHEDTDDESVIDAKFSTHSSACRIALWLCGEPRVAPCRRACAAGPKFERIVIDDNFPGGYQVEVADVNGDGRPDIVGAGRRDAAPGTRTRPGRSGSSRPRSRPPASSAAPRPTSTATARPRSPSPTSSR